MSTPNPSFPQNLCKNATCTLDDFKQMKGYVKYKHTRLEMEFMKHKNDEEMQKKLVNESIKECAQLFTQKL